MGMNKFPVAGGVITDATTRLNDNFELGYRQCGLNLIRQLEDRSVTFNGVGGEWAEAYNVAAGRLSSVAVAETSAEFDTNKYKARDFNETNYVIIEATSLTMSSFRINNCDIFLIEAGKWCLYCTVGTDEVKRAQIYKTLFYGTNGTDPRITTATGVTAIRTSVTRDVGNMAYYCTISRSNAWGTGSGDMIGRWYGNFAATIDNADISAWSLYSVNSTGSPYLKIQSPISTDIYSNTNSSGTHDTFGTDMSAIEVDNTASIALMLRIYRSSSAPATSGSGRYLFLTKKSVSLTYEDTGTHAASSTSKTDFATDHSIPVMTAVTTAPTGAQVTVVTHNIPTGTYKSTINTCIGVPKVVDYEDGASVQYKLTNATEDTGWLDANTISSFTAFTSEPTECVVKLIPKTTSPTAGYPSISGFCILSDSNL